MIEEKIKFEDAYFYVKSKRSQIFPNFGFQRQLKKLEIDLGLISEQQFLEEIKFKTVLVK